MTITATATVRMLTRCRKCRTPRTEDVPAREATSFFFHVSCQGGGFEPYRRCRNCGAGLHRWNQLKSRYNSEVACNARCMGASGPSCECSCGGDNHGGGNL